ncbi:hypothetical protein OB905_13275 [Halobacteria archaeon AArc-dxtr1]|nr:hypothetical protein [Halobacteria archaeon AArc-dxtr1]
MPSEETESGDEPTLEEFALRRRAHDRPTSVWVQADTQRDPPEGRVLADRIAHLLTDDGEVHETDLASVPETEPGDVVLISASSLDELVEVVREQLALTRIKERSIVVHVDELPKRVQEVLDVRVSATGDKHYSEVVRLVWHPYENMLFERPLSGLGGVSDAE